MTSRIGGGFGYKTPTIFTEESEKLLYRNVLPVNAAANNLERSYGANWDVNYKTLFEEVSFSINQFFFYTYLNHPLILDTLAGGFYRFQNLAGHISSKGAETNIRFGYDDVALYLGYTYTNAKITNNNVITQNPLTPKHRFNAALIYEIDGRWRIGLELYYFSKQKLTNGNEGKGYLLTGLIVERGWKNISVYSNFENITDVRQTNFESIYTGTITNPVFKDIYAPLDGFIVNAGVIVKF